MSSISWKCRWRTCTRVQHGDCHYRRTWFVPSVTAAVVKKGQRRLVRIVAGQECTCASSSLAQEWCSRYVYTTLVSPYFQLKESNTYLNLGTSSQSLKFEATMHSMLSISFSGFGLGLKSKFKRSENYSKKHDRQPWSEIIWYIFPIWKVNADSQLQLNKIRIVFIVLEL